MAAAEISVLQYYILNEWYVDVKRKLMPSFFSFDIHTFVGLMNLEISVGVCGLH
jgi:hypothetical protein